MTQFFLLFLFLLFPFLSPSVEKKHSKHCTGMHARRGEARVELID